MDTPRVSYTRSSSGVDIAYAVFGTGPPLVYLSPLVTGGLDLRFRSPRTVPFYEALAAKRTVITFDWRNTGLSGPAVDFELADLVSDLSAVIDQAGLVTFDLW